MATKEQTKKQSFIEASTNTAVGFVISLASTFIIFPLVGFETSPSKNIVVTLFFTAVSILRGYVIRRCFNKKIDTKQQLLACVCNNEDKHGQTTVWCCNECGKPTEDFWLK